MPRTPKCPECGSTDLYYPGFCTFRWSKGEWRMERGSAQMATEHGAPIHCHACGSALHCDNINDPSVGLTKEDFDTPRLRVET